MEAINAARLEYLLKEVQNGLPLRKVPLELRSEKICLEAVRNCGTDLIQAPLEQRTSAVCLAAVRNNRDALKAVPENVLERWLEDLEMLERGFYSPGGVQ